MLNLLPAVLVGGPPNAGKSVLFYRLTQALRERGISHHAIRACPDGEGNWFHESDPTLISKIQVKLKGAWPSVFVERMCQDLERRCLPLLVDMGGSPRDSQIELFRLCTHSILLLRSDKPDYTDLWERLVAQADLLPLARLRSEKDGLSTITTTSPVLEGTISGLERHKPDVGASDLFDTLVEQVAALFSSYDLKKQKQMAPTELFLDLEEAIHTFAPSSTRWEPEMLQSFLEGLPAHTPLSIYGAAPGWLYAALASYSNPKPLYLFDPKIGWIQPVRVSLGEAEVPDLHIEYQSYDDMTVLTIKFPFDRIGYFQPDPLIFPHVDREKGLIINGKVPNWLLTALMRLYQEAGVAWIAPFYVPLNQAIVAYSRQDAYRPGDPVSKPAL